MKVKNHNPLDRPIILENEFGIEWRFNRVPTLYMLEQAWNPKHCRLLKCSGHKNS